MKTYGERTQDILNRISRKHRRRKMTVQITVLCSVLAVAVGVGLVKYGGVGIRTVLSNDKYAIRQNGDNFYLEFHDDSYEDEYKGQNSGSDWSKPATAIGFPSVAKMKQTIEEGSFTAVQLRDMQNLIRIGGGKVEVCDLNNLYDAALPEGVNLDSINWYGKTYNLYFSADQAMTNYGVIKLVTKEYVEKQIKMMDKSTEAIISRTVDPQTGGTVICYELNGLKKQILYSYTEGGNTVTVQEMYYEEENGMEIPHRIDICGNYGDQYFDCYIYGLKERPSYEWIKSFGLVPYVEKEVA